MSDDTPARFVSLVMRELGAVDVIFREADDPPGEDAVAASLPDGRFVEAELATPPDDVQALSRRLEMLVGAFEGLAQSLAQKRREPPAAMLKKELRSLVKRSRGVGAAVIDAKSPVVWASAGLDDGESEAAKAAADLRERALRESLPRVERLVLALPPLDPEPVPAGVVALRPRRRRLR